MSSTKCGCGKIIPPFNQYCECGSERSTLYPKDTIEGKVMNYTDKVKKLSKAIDDLYSNLEMSIHLPRSQQDKLESLYKDLTYHFMKVKRVNQEELNKELGVTQRQ